MATRLYEALGISSDATPEDIRKAYKKKALKTHPDRLPAGASDEDKSAAAEEFRIVNNAYEVLCDPEKRREYDRAGVWPPDERPEHSGYERGYHNSSRHGSRSRHHADNLFGDAYFRNNSFFNAPHERFFGRSTYPHDFFSDPFTVFNSFFGDSFMPRQHDMFDRHRQHRGMHSRHQSPFDDFPIRAFSMFDNMDSMFNAPRSSDPRSRSFQSATRGVFTSNGNGGGRWVSETVSSVTTGSGTKTMRKRTDSNGNEHVTYTYPDGQERHLINGVEQATPVIPSSRSKHQDSIQPPPAYSPSPYPVYTENSRPVPYTRSSANRNEEMDPVHEEPHSKQSKRWWRGSR